MRSGSLSTPFLNMPATFARSQERSSGCWIDMDSSLSPARQPGRYSGRDEQGRISEYPGALPYRVRLARLGDMKAVTRLESMVFGPDAYSEETLRDLAGRACRGCGAP